MTLIHRLESATEGSRELDGLIYRAINPQIPEEDWHESGGVWYSRDPIDRIAFDVPPDYTTSIDAALQLVPEGWRMYSLRWYALNVMATIWDGEMIPGKMIDAGGRTPALALCIASLKAREPTNG